jgi:hypothetical protein
MIAKDFPFMKEKHRIRCFSFVIMGLACGGDGNVQQGRYRGQGLRLAAKSGARARLLSADR